MGKVMDCLVPLRFGLCFGLLYLFGGLLVLRIIVLVLGGALCFAGLKG